MSKITIILPSYNVREYIEKCLESVVNQTYSNLEILCIDAGSTDGTAEILKRFEKKDSRVKVIFSDKKSYGHQINLGIKQSSGDYIGIVETDDWIEPDMYSTLLNLMEKTDSDYVKGKGEMFFALPGGVSYNMEINGVFDDGHVQNYTEREVFPCDTPELLLKDYYLWSGLYKRSLIENIVLNETNGAAFQDIGFLIQSFIRSKKAVYINKVVYHYRKSNIAASSYDANSVDILLNEYKYADSLLEGSDIRWRVAAEKKLMLQAFHRIRMMAYVGSFREEAADSLDALKERLVSSMDKGCMPVTNYTEYEWYNLGLFLESPRMLYDRLAASLAESRKNIEEMLSATKGRNCAIFGCGKKGIYLSFILLKKGIAGSIVFCDNNKEKQGMTVNGLGVISPNEALREENPLFILTGKYAKEMRQQLIEKHIREDSIVDFNAPEDYGMFLML